MSKYTMVQVCIVHTMIGHLKCITYLLSRNYIFSLNVNFALSTYLIFLPSLLVKGLASETD